MPTVLDTPPRAIAADLGNLQAALDVATPAKKLDRNLLIATWNLRAFGGLTDRWVSTDDDSLKRDLTGLRAIGEIVARFDVIALH